MFPETMGRVPAHTPAEVNRRIQHDIERSLRYHAEHPHLIEDRLEELDQEWDIERILEANASSIILLGLGLATAVDRRFLWLPAAVAGFLLQHAVQGWCPPVTMFRRWGVRTAAEIDQERYALKALRGDFAPLSSRGSGRERGEAALRAVRA
jgi:hypothetical protein